MSLFKPRARYNAAAKLERLESVLHLARYMGSPSDRHKHEWFNGRPIAHKLIGRWAQTNEKRWVMWPGASPQLKEWNKMMPPIRSMQIDLGLTDEETKGIFQNPRIQTKDDLVKHIRALIKRSKANASGTLG